MQVFRRGGKPGSHCCFAGCKSTAKLEKEAKALGRHELAGVAR